LSLSFTYASMALMDRQPAGVRRLPKNYALLLDIVRAGGRGTHRTASDIFALARAERRGIGFATVHRGLARLCELGTISKIEVGGEAAWYETAAPAHAHLLCEACGRVVDVEYAIAPRTLRAIAQRAGVRIGAENVTFRGACHDCAAAAAR